MTLKRGILEIDANIDGQERTGVFHIVGNVEIAEQTTPSYVMEGFGGNINAITGGYLDRGSDTTRRRGIWVDLGAGSHLFEIDFMGWEGAVDSDGNAVQWGDGSGNPKADATGEDPLTQIQVFNQYLRRGTTDSISPARFKVGEYSPNGVFEDYLNVAVQAPREVHSYDAPNEYDGSMTVVEVEDLETTHDAKERLGF